jgi:hypothetical protein
MRHPHRPRNLIEALFNHPFVGSDNGDRGIGPTLGEDVGEPPLPPASPRPRQAAEPRVFAVKPHPTKPGESKPAPPKPRSSDDDAP